MRHKPLPPLGNNSQQLSLNISRVPLIKSGFQQFGAAEQPDQQAPCSPRRMIVLQLPDVAGWDGGSVCQARACVFGFMIK